MASISIRSVEKRYERSGAPAIAGLNLEIGDAEFLCLLGPSGCGKTTTLRMIAGLEHPTRGEIALDGRKIVSVSDGIFTPAEDRNLGLVFQSYALWPHMTVEQNIAFGLKLKKVPAAERERIIADVTQKLGIARYRTRLPSQLSGGQQQRVALARMLALKPEVILLDEPLSNLDAKLRLEMRAELKRIHRDMDATIVFVTHDQWEAMTLATTIAVMSEGELQQLGTPDDIYERPANRFVAEFVGNLPINIIDLSAKDSALSHWMAACLAEYGLAGAAAATVGVRPENLVLGMDPASAAALQATVLDVVPTGGSWIVELAAEGEKIFAIAAQTPEARVGDTLAVGVDRNRLHLFDAKGQRIEPTALAA